MIFLNAFMKWLIVLDVMKWLIVSDVLFRYSLGANPRGVKEC